MRAARNLSLLALLVLLLSGTARAQESDDNLANRQQAPTVLGGSGLFNTFSTRTLCRGEFKFGVFWNNFDRDPGDLDINQVPFNFTVGLTNRWELWVNWVAWQQVTSRNPFLLSGYQYNAVRLFGDPFEILGPAVDSNGGAAFFPGTGVGSGILPRLGLLGTPFGVNRVTDFSPRIPGGPVVAGLGASLITDLPAFYNDLPFFGEVDFLGFDSLGRAVLGARSSSNGTGDFTVGTKFNLIDPDENWFSAAIGGYLKIPISQSDSARARGRTSGEYEYGPILMLGQEFSNHRFRIYENIGYIRTSDISRGGVKTLDLRDKLLLNAGVSVALNKYVELVGELAYTRYVGGGTPSLFRSNPLDLNIGARFFFKDGAISFGGAYRYSWTGGSARAASGLECFVVREDDDKDHDDHHSDKKYGGYGPPKKPPKERIECRPREVRFEDSSRHGFVGFFSIGNKKGCPPPPAPTCVLAAAPTMVNRGERLSLNVTPTTPGYADNKLTYEYRWEVRDARGQVVPVSGSGSSVDVLTSQLDCGSYTVTTTVTATASAVDCPDYCVTTGQTTCTASFEITEPPCPTVSCSVSASPTSVNEGERITLRATGSGASDLRYTWSTTGGRLSSTTGSEVTLNTTGVRGTVTVTVSVANDRSRCGEPCPGGSCSTTVTVYEIPTERPRPQIIVPCGPIFFPFNSARINNEHKACLDDIALRLQSDPQSTVVIDGHRDRSERVGISLTRANNARDYLINDKGIDPSRIRVRNFGDTCDDTSGDPALNRRVEFFIIPEGASIDDVESVKKCSTSSSPRVITTETPAPSIERRTPTRRAPRRRGRRPEPIALITEEAGETRSPAYLSPPPAASSPRTVPTTARREVAAAPATVIRSLRTEVSGGVLRIILDADGALKFNSFSLADPLRIVVDLAGVRNLPGSKMMPVGTAQVDRLRIGEPQPGVVRLVLDMKMKTTYQVIREGSSLIILVGDAAALSRLDTASITPVVTMQ